MARPASTIALATALLAGCGTGDETDSYRLVQVSGHVTLDGKPLEGAKVLFTPSEANKPNTPGVDVTGQEGNYKLMYRGRSGVAPGTYQVFVAKTVDPAALKIPEEYKDDPVLAAMAKQEALISQKAKNGGRATASFNVSSSFDREVSSKGEVFDFDIKATGKKK
ncbi:carboxypeptidase-like regulatory domain-containing protein [Singulisphaera acidiphila]|uniref:Carboxypeptidase regulatory-like domain-containing protein n=1 Tax=Singulisphaera acidiphila (strain ATCC BAA-1392 / DSM 18658 / VKM B-2454 / MOB10) TaxID=886293 RepID=L0DR29_SINAD|nr:carboxypeptidase-like regulatory domain-containing protein [Singulisphaera acidiphila]AGA31417.1 hypothetical protein Sinac_7378 [Singulisphaera acidiphila DSM 18658]